MGKHLAKLLSNKVMIYGLLIIMQFAIFVIIITTLGESEETIYNILNIISTLIVLWLVRKKDNPAYKILWIIVILIFPLVGGVVYLFMGNTPFNRARFVKVKPIMRPNIENVHYKYSDLTSGQRKHLRNMKYIENMTHMPVWTNTQSGYFPVGEEFLKELLVDLRSARKCIFLQYFIIAEGYMWDEILKILIQKANNGVEILVMYDDFGSAPTLPLNYEKYLESFGIKCLRFNKVRPMLNTYLNYRNHRKICIVDGNIGYTGGINLADEYINKKERFGHWKDTAIKLKGEGVTGLTAIFLELWNFSSNENKRIEEYMPTIKVEGDGAVQPFSDSPLDKYNISASVYMNIINNATRYVYITTPYLLLDNEMLTALINAAHSGVDVKIITPYVPDKWYVHMQTRSFYGDLIEAGVKIYEYHPGFMHSKTIVSDDSIAIVGTVNMDFRSFYMNFECATAFYDCEIVNDVYYDFNESVSKSRRITKRDIGDISPIAAFVVSILRVFAPLM